MVQINPVPTLLESASNDPYGSFEAMGIAARLQCSGEAINNGTLELLAGPNPFGGMTCKVGPVPRGSRDWRMPVLPSAGSLDRGGAALLLAAHWFRAIGNIDRIDRALLGHIVQRLKSGRGRGWLHVAIREYAASKWQSEHKKWMAPHRFFKTDEHIALWIRPSAEWRDYVRRHRRDELQKQQAKVQSPPAHPPAHPPVHPPARPGSPGGLSPRASLRYEARKAMHDARKAVQSLPDDDLRAECWRAKADASAHATAYTDYAWSRDAIWAQAWDRLTSAQRNQLAVEVEREFSRGRRRRDGTAIFDHSDPEFRRELHRRAWLLLSAADPRGPSGLSVPPFVPPPPTAHFPAELLREEARRRFGAPGAPGRY